MISKLKEQIDPEIQKASDINQGSKNISGALYKLQEKQKITSTVICYLLNDNSYDIAQNKEKESALVRNLKSFIPHSCGEHDSCDSQWCGYLKATTNYRPQSLPYGKDLSGDKLYKDLTELL